MRRTASAVLTATLGLSLAVMSAPAATAKDGDVIQRGSCSQGATWKLKASPENGRIEVEGEIDTNRVGQKWRWRMSHNGSLSARGRATTTAPSGSFERRRVLVNLNGRDSFVFRARHRASGQVCVARVNF